MPNVKHIIFKKTLNYIRHLNLQHSTVAGGKSKPMGLDSNFIYFCRNIF